jgi:hypothetical protein
MDKNVRSSHADAFERYGGEENAIPIDEQFEVENADGEYDKMDFTKDPSASPENVIRCRCEDEPYFKEGTKPTDDEVWTGE